MDQPSQVRQGEVAHSEQGLMAEENKPNLEVDADLSSEEG
jgi:hypothetical protein